MTDAPPQSSRSRSAGSGLSYHSPDYWNHRFTTDPREASGFEWLSSSSSLLDCIPPKLLLRELAPRILHIGVGTSKLSLDIVRYLREHSRSDWMERARCIVNVDFSPNSIEFQRSAERQFLQEVGEEQVELMSYRVLDLLDWTQVSTALATRFDLILDKSTTDSISTGEDIPLPTISHSPTTYHPSLVHFAQKLDRSEKGVATPQILGTHLSAISNNNALWLCHSYSSHRWEDNIADGWMWKEVERSAVAVESGDLNAPKIFHWIYTLQHT